MSPWIWMQDQNPRFARLTRLQRLGCARTAPWRRILWRHTRRGRPR